jgi:phage shock protein PspC (stress-responsive transcriptional regulator)
MSETPSSPEPDQDAPQSDGSPDPGEQPTTQAPRADADAPPPPPDPGEQPTTQAPRADAPPPPPPPPNAGPPRPRRLLRSRDDRVLGGVCGGLARYFNVDPLIVRIAAVALVFVGGFAVIAYIAALLLVPDDDGTGQAVAGKPGRLATILGAVAIVIAGVTLLDGSWNVGTGWIFGAVAPIVLIVLVLAIAGQRLLANRGESQPALGRIAGAALLVTAICVGIVVAAAGAAVATAAGAGSAIAGVVILLGGLMIGLSFRDRRAGWLALPALVLAIPSGVVAAAGVDTDNGVGSRHYAPASVADLRAGGYELGVGELEIDLRTMAWPAERPVNLKVDVGTGHVLVLVPEDVCVQADSHAGLGWVEVLGDGNGGADIDEQQGTIVRTAAAKKLVLDADVGIGAIEVRHARSGGRWDHDHHTPDEIDDALADAGCGGDRA